VSVFRRSIPPGWLDESDGEGGRSIYREDGAGLLTLISFPGDSDEDLDPAEELYAFLEEQGIEIEEDEVEDIDLADGGSLALCEYLEEEDEDEGEGEVYWLVAVAAWPGQLVFASYSCPEGEGGGEIDEVRAILGSLRPGHAEPGAGEGGT